jgi:hypothetical protein
MMVFRDLCLAAALGLQITSCIGRPVPATLYLAGSLIFTASGAWALADLVKR